MAIESSVVFLPVKDIEETTRFYQDLIGLPVAQVQSGGLCRIFDTGYGYFGFCQYSDGRPLPNGPKGVCLSFNCRDEEDVDAHYREFTQRGLTATTPQRHKVFPVYSFFLTDPNGYNVEFQKILEQ